MNGAAVVFGAEGLQTLCALSAWIRSAGGAQGEPRVERDRVAVLRRGPHRP
jgi:hypothetical protein